MAATLTAGEGLDPHYDAVVVGSGFGAAVSAYRLATAGLKVCVLERGKAYPPDSFPRSPSAMARNFWDPSEGHHGLFDVWSFKGIEAVTASGLGGGSLIYANVLLPKDESWFLQRHPYKAGETEPWPVTLEDLQPHYDVVAAFLDAQTLPTGDGAPVVPKYQAMVDAAPLMGEGTTHGPAPLAVRFRGPGGELVPPGTPLPPAEYGSIFGPGANRRTCRLCGECDIGCNDGAKNTLDHTYLSAASAQGAHVSVRSEVVGLRRRDGGGFEVDFAVHLPEHEGRRIPTSSLPRTTLTADRVILGAGSIGTTYLLLRNQAGLGLANPALGTRYCGNGDLLGFVFLANALDGAPLVIDGSRGPAITHYIRWPDQVDTGDPADHGVYLQDAGYPYFLQWLFEAPIVMTQGLRVATRRVMESLTGLRRTSLSSDLADLLGSGRLTATSLPLLAMGRDVPDGRLFLGDPMAPGRPPRLDSSWTVETSKAYYEHVRAGMSRLADALEGRLLVNPTYFLQRLITVHSVGGCPMGVDPTESVTDEWCQVRGVPGLFVADGAVLPGPVGPNPALTIAAIADRMCDAILSGAPA